MLPIKEKNMNKNIDVVFIGHFPTSENIYKEASSVAGNQVQIQIIKELVDRFGDEKSVVYSMEPRAAWPKNSLITSSESKNSIHFIGYINILLFKHILFSIRLFLKLLTTRPSLCIQYNSYLFENIAMVIYGLINRKSILAVIIQDVHAEKNERVFSKRWLRSHAERASLNLAKHFNIIIPISKAIITDFCIEPRKCIVFSGGITDFSLNLMQPSNSDLEMIGVFAGGLEPHNGVDRLVERWIESDIQYQLHIFGRGSLEQHIQKLASLSNRIVFHGFQPEDVVLNWQRKALWNFCFRYSIGLNQKYFFPSKLFNIMCAPGAVIVNEFHGLPDDFREYICIISDDFCNLQSQLLKAASLINSEFIDKRRSLILTKHSWKTCITSLVSHINTIQN